jgi:hypothetical protein
MSPHPRPSRLPWLAALIAAALATIALVVFLRSDPPAADQTAGPTPAPESPGPAHRGERPGLSADPGVVPGVAPGEAADPGDESGNEYPVDLERLRARIPDNLYWRLGAPTKDPQVLQARAAEEQRWNELYGKVQSGTASEEEIQRYYDHRRKLSEDYLAFARLVLQEYGDELPERDRGLYDLSIEMHTSRLAEIPGKIDEARARKQEQDRRREEWRSSQ